MKYIPTLLDGFGGLAWHIVLIASMIGLTGCTLFKPPSDPIRQIAEICKIATAKEISSKCGKEDHIEVVDAANPSNSYSLQFVEIDDQGFFSDRKQANRAIKFAEEKPKDGKDRIFYVVYVHGWFHGPEMSDDQLPGFLKALENLSRWRPSGEVRGIYIGWRGKSLDLLGLRYLTFWDRKSVSEEVGRGSSQEFLLQLEKTIQLNERQNNKNGKKNKLATIGHSFGASVVFNALSHTLVQRFIDGVFESAKPRGYGDLVVLINPAFEAMRFLPIYSMVNHFTMPENDGLQPRIPKFDNSGRPYFVVLSSEGDWATNYAFPAGRFFSTIWESHPPANVNGRGTEKINGWVLDRDTIGNFKGFASFEKLDRAKGNAPAEVTICPQPEQELWKKLSEIRSNDKKGDSQEKRDSPVFPEIDFILRNSYDHVNSPFLLTAVDKSIINDHTTIGGDDLACWIVQLADD
jgi:hypothetical protein